MSESVAADGFAIGTDDPSAWSAWLARMPHCFFHSWEFCSSIAASTGLRTYLWCYDDGQSQACCPVAERRLGADVDVVTPQGFSGFTSNGAAPGLAEAWQRWCVARGYVCAYVGLNPLFARPGWFDLGDVGAAQTLYILDLRRGPEALRAGLQDSMRRKLRSAAPVEHSDEVGRDEMAGFFVHRFADCYSTRGAGSACELGEASLEALAHAPQTFLLGVRVGSELESVTLFARTADSGEGVFNVCTDAGRPHAFTLVWNGALRMQAERVPFLNLGGGIREGDGVAQFKRRFGGEERPLLALRQIYDSDRYRALCLAANVSTERRGYFPAYRSPDLTIV